MANPVTYSQVRDFFHMRFKSRYELASELEYQYFLGALGEYQLDISELNYDMDARAFPDGISLSVMETLGIMMYCRYLTQELSRVLKLNGISGKDVQLTGIPATKTTTFAELNNEYDYYQRLLYKQKRHCFV